MKKKVVSFVRCPLCDKKGLNFNFGVVANCAFCNSWVSAKNNRVYIIADNYHKVGIEEDCFY